MYSFKIGEHPEFRPVIFQLMTYNSINIYIYIYIHKHKSAHKSHALYIYIAFKLIINAIAIPYYRLVEQIHSDYF